MIRPVTGDLDCAEFIAWIEQAPGPIGFAVLMPTTNPSMEQAVFANSEGIGWLLCLADAEVIKRGLHHQSLVTRDINRVALFMRKVCGCIPPDVIDLNVLARVTGIDPPLTKGPSELSEAADVSAFADSVLNSASGAALSRAGRDHQLIHVLDHITQRGILLDRRLMTSSLTEAGAASEALAASFRFNPRSQKKTQQHFDRLGASYTKYSDSGLPSFSEAGLQTLTHATQPSAVRELAQRMLQYLAAVAPVAKLEELGRHIERDDRVRPVIAVSQAITGRMSISNPAIQNIPTTLRHLFLAEPDRVLVSCDLSQIELRVAAALSKDEQLISDLSSGDFYSQAAKKILGPHADSTARKVAKETTFVALYGGGAQAIANKTGFDLLEATDLLQQFREIYPTLHSWGHFLRSRDTITNEFGRTIPIAEGSGYKAVNYMIQSTARDLFADQILTAHQDGLDIWLPVHDEIIVQARHDEAPQVAMRLQDLMTTELLGVPITAKATVRGPRWAPLPD